jgi:hypothetical protein
MLILCLMFQVGWVWDIRLLPGEASTYPSPHKLSYPTNGEINWSFVGCPTCPKEIPPRLDIKAIWNDLYQSFSVPGT